MKIQTPLPIALALMAASVAAGSAQTFQYSTSDLLIGFQEPGGLNEVLMDLGPVTTYSTQAPGTTVSVPLQATLLSDAFPGGFNNARFSAFADVKNNAVASPWGTNYPYGTIWSTRPRASLGLQSSVWPTDFGGSKNASVLGSIEGFSANAVTFAANPNIAPPAGSDNNATGIALPVGDPVYSYSTFVGPIGNIQGKWWGNIEKTITTVAPVGRSDFYESLPGVTTRYLGYFQFYTDGTMTFTAGTLSIPQPTITSINKSAGTATVGFTPTVTGAAYTLIGTNDVRNSFKTWPTLSGSSVPGTGSPASTSGTNSNFSEIFMILAQ